MTRRLFTFTAVISAALSVAAITAWIASDLRPAHFAIDGTAIHNASIEVGSGWAWWITSGDGVLDVQPVGSFYEWKVPYWKLVVALLLLPAWQVYLRVRTRRERLRAGLCRQCGYDLRASSDRCPECGTAIPPNCDAKA